MASAGSEPAVDPRLRSAALPNSPFPLGAQEYALAATAFGLDEAALVQLATAAVRAAFVTDSEREALLARLEAFVRAGPGGS